RPARGARRRARRDDRRPALALGGDDVGAAERAGRAVVTAEQVWDAVAELPDPEIPFVSLVDLGVVRGVEVRGREVRVEFTPTFLGCPALETMRERIAARIEALGAEPQVDVVDDWSTDRITPAGRAKLREA